MQNVFVSSTYEDLKNHREMIRKVIGRMGWHPLMMEDFGTETGATVSECLSKVRQADLVVLVVAFKRGWVPRPDQGGRDGKSVTALELDEARRLGKPVRVLLAVDNWPVRLSETDGEARAWVESFRGELNQIADKFTIEQYDPQVGEPIPGNDFRGRVHQLLLDHRESLAPPPVPEVKGRAGFGPMLKSISPLLCAVVVPRHELTRIYQRFKPSDWPAPPTELAAPALLSWCVEKLAGALRRHDDRVPLLGFLRALTVSLPAEQALPLAGWIETALVHLGRDEEDQQRLRAALAQPAPELAEEPGLLLVQMEPSKFKPGEYRLKAWLHGTCQLPKRREGDTDLSLDGLREDIRALCQECEELCPQCEELRIEFLLPRSLLAFDLDWTPVLDEYGDAVALCTRHRVVVRPLDRHQKLRAGAVKQPWQRRWTHLENSRQSLCRVVWPLPSEPSDCLVVRAGDAEGDPLVSKFKMLSSVVCVIMERPPDSSEPTNKGQFFPSLKAGIPAALWLRGGSEGLDQLVSLLDTVELGTLPDYVRELQLKANSTQDAAHLGRRISLMWDDPNRLAPDEDPETNHPLTHPARLPLS